VAASFVAYSAGSHLIRLMLSISLIHDDADKVATIAGAAFTVVGTLVGALGQGGAGPVRLARAWASSDDDAVNVAFGHGIDSTVKRMGQLKRPDETGPTRQKKERRVYRLWAIFDSIPPSDTSPGVKLDYKTEDNDNDIHLAIRDSTGATMVVEFPHHSCTVGAQHRWEMTTAREALVKACSNKVPPHDPPKSFVELHGSARITGFSSSTSHTISAGRPRTSRSCIQSCA
jgi:hypothetical protein